MNPTIEIISDFDEKYFTIFSEIMEEVVPSVRDSEYKVTGLSLIGLMGTANSLKLGMMDLSESCESHLYVLKTLSRSLIEHFLRYYHVLVTFLKDKSDHAGIEYRQYSQISEAQAYMNATLASAKIVGKSQEELILKYIKKYNDDLGISKKKISEITFKWKHRNIVRFIKNNSNLIPVSESFFILLISEYSSLSSFIHGGTSAEEYYHEVTSKDKLKSETVFEIQRACMMCAYMKHDILYALDLMVSKDLRDDQEKLFREFSSFSEKYS